MSRTPKDSGGKGSGKFSLQKRHFELELHQPGKLLLSYLPCHYVHHTLPPEKKKKYQTTLHPALTGPCKTTLPHCSPNWNLQGEAEEVLSLRVQEPTQVTQQHQPNSCWLILENESINTALTEKTITSNNCFNSGDDQHFCQRGSGCSQGIS